MVLSDDPETRRRQIAAIMAKGGFGHSGGGYHKQTSHEILSGIGHVAENVSIEAGIGAASAVFPQAGAIYGIYKGVKFAKEIYDVYKNEPKNKNYAVLEKLCNTCVNNLVASSLENLSSDVVGNISSEIRHSCENNGILNSMSTSIGIPENIMGNIIENSISNGILSGIDDFASYVIEEVVGG
jgi:hypothetical protein